MKQLLTLFLYLVINIVCAQVRNADPPVRKTIEISNECESFTMQPLDGVSVTPVKLIESLVGPGFDSFTLINFQGIAVGDLETLPFDASAAVFSGGLNAGIGIERGIVLSTGLIENAVGPNMFRRINGVLNIPGDPDLEAELGAGIITRDATILEFEFVTVFDEVFIEFVFGSDEYTETINNAFSDVFGFFINGVNVAVTEGTGQPINTLTINPNVNSEFYINNECYDFTNPPCNDWPRYCNEMDGFTTVLTVSAAVNPGVPNTIKISIADVGDNQVDSWVFIREKGLSGRRAEMSVEKTADKTYFNQVGETVRYAIKVVNSGNVTLNNVKVNDDLTDDSFTITSLLPGFSRQFEVFHFVNQSNMDDGLIINTVTASAVDPEGLPVSAFDMDTVYLATDAYRPAISIEKTAAVSSYSAVGETVQYNLLIRNTGNVTIRNISVSDDLTGNNWEIASLAPGQNRTFVANYTINQADMDRGYVENLATAAGLSPRNEPVTASDSDELPLNPDAYNPEITISKSANIDNYLSVNQEITYKIVVVNTGNLTIHNIVVEDFLTADIWMIDVLSPGDQITFVFSYSTMQHDMDSGSLMNVAQATGFDPNDNVVSGSTELVIPAAPGSRIPEISLQKKTNQTNYTIVGEVIVYSLVVSNTGNLTLSDILVHDGLTDENWSVDLLSPGESHEFTTFYIIAQIDINRGYVLNEASASGTDPDGQTVNSADEEIILVDPSVLRPIITVQKRSGQAFFTAVGESVDYEIVVTNSGNLTITGILITDDLSGGTWNIEFLAPGQEMTFNTAYVITQDDFDRGNVLNILLASGLDPSGNPVGDDDSYEIQVDPDVLDPGISIRKEAGTDMFASPGEQVTYTIEVTNSGNLTLTDIQVNDELTGAAWTETILAPGQSVSFQTNYTIKLEDLLNGQVYNVANVKATAANGAQPEASADHTLNEAPYSEPDLEFVSINHVRCHGEANGSIEINITGGREPFTFSWSNGTTTKTIDQLPPGYYSVVVTDIKGNQATAGTNINEPAELVISGISITGVYYIGDPLGSITYDIGGGTPPYEFSWSTGAKTQPLYNIPGGDYLLIIRDANGCELQQQFVVPYETIECPLEVPGAITPNNDGYNDALVINCLHLHPNNSIKIFNRWGTLIFEAAPYTNDWDGIPNRGNIGKDYDGRVTPGVYFYILQPGTDTDPLSGYIYLVK